MSKAAELANLASASETALSNRNIIINGAMQIAQRSTSVADIGASAGYFTCDRWKITVDAASAGRLTMTQTSDGPSGFANCIKLDCTTVDTSIAAGEILLLRHSLEGQDLQQIKKGTSDAELITLSFYVKANAAFTFGVELYDLDNNRQITKLFDTTTGWVRHELTFPADTTGAFGDDNAASLNINFWLHSGSTYTSGTLNSSSWASPTNANRAAGIDSFFSSTDNNFFITGIQMESGPVATPFEHRSFGQELALCQRYYWNTYNGAAIGSNTGQVNVIGRSAGGQTYETIAEGHFPTTMRAVPTMQIYNSITGTAGSIRGDSSDFATCVINFRGVNYYSFNMSNVAIGQSTFVSGNVTADAEL